VGYATFEPRLSRVGLVQVQGLSVAADLREGAYVSSVIVLLNETLCPTLMPRTLSLSLIDAPYE
jgi:hypothetical protein